MNFFDERMELKKKDLKNKEILNSILKTRADLNSNINNYEYAENELIDFFLYQIKANKAKLDYLLKLAKENKIEVRKIENIK